MAVDIYRVWRERAAELGLDAGDRSEIGAAAFAADVPPAREFGPYSRLERQYVLAHLEAMARRRRPTWRTSVSRGTLTVAVDPAGRVDDLRAAVPELVAQLREQAREIRDAWIVDEVRDRLARGDRLEVVAIAIGISVSTVKRARSRVTDASSVTLADAESGRRLAS